jgi:capsular polysaccharide biosynthesis protein
VIFLRKERSNSKIPGDKLSVVVGLVAAILVLAGGFAFWLANPPEYEASSTLLVFPNEEQSSVSEYYDVLSSGQIVETYSGVINLNVVASSPVAGEVTRLEAAVVPNTSLIRVTATAPKPEVAEAAVNSVVDRAGPYLERLNSVYTASVLSPATGTATRVGAPAGTFVAAVLLVALVVGVAVQQAALALARAGRRVPEPRSPVGDRENVLKGNRDGASPPTDAVDRVPSSS